MLLRLMALGAVVLGACRPASPPETPAAPQTGAEERYGPLQVGADHASYRKVSTGPFLSQTHGGRFVEVFVNDVGHKAYVSGAEIPVGTIIVKTSVENEDGSPGTTPGPIFVMKKQAAGYLPRHGDWYYAIHWEKPTPEQLTALGGPIYWRGHSRRVAYCANCHDDYDRQIGGVPKGHRAWEPTGAAAP